MTILKKRIIPFILCFTLVFSVVAKPMRAEASFTLAGTAAVAATAAKVIGVAALVTAVAAGASIALSDDDDIQSLANTIGSNLISRRDSLDSTTQGFIDSVFSNLFTNPLHYSTIPIKIGTTLFAGLLSHMKDYVGTGEIEMPYSDFAQTVVPSGVWNMLNESQASTIANADKFIITCIASANMTTYYVHVLDSATSYGVISETGKQVSHYTEDNALVGGGTNKMYFYSLVNGATAPSAWSNSTSSKSQITTNDAHDASYTAYHGINVLTYDQAVAMRLVDVPIDTALNDVALKEDIEITLDDATGVVVGDKAVTDFMTVVDGVGSDTDTDVGIDTGILTGIRDDIKSLPDAITSKVSALFTPSVETLDTYEELKNRKFPVLNQVQTWADEFKYIIGHPQEYSSNLSFIVDFGKARTHWDYGGSQTDMIELDWYFEYKDKVDDIIVGIAWLIFVWNLYGQLPAIISLVGTGVYVDSRTSRGKNRGDGNGN